MGNSLRETWMASDKILDFYPDGEHELKSDMFVLLSLIKN